MALFFFFSPAQIWDVQHHAGHDHQLHRAEQDHGAHVGLHSEDCEFDGFTNRKVDFSQKEFNHFFV